jgi:hypothetical protein
VRVFSVKPRPLSLIYLNILSRLGGLHVTHKTGFGLNDWIYCTLYIHTSRHYRQCSSISVLHTFQFTVTQAQGSSVFTSHILATDLLQFHDHFKSHMKSSLRRLIPFLPLFCSCEFRRLESTTLDYCCILHRVKVKVSLRLAVCCQSVRLGARPLETHDQNFF